MVLREFRNAPYCRVLARGKNSTDHRQFLLCSSVILHFGESPAGVMGLHDAKLRPQPCRSGKAA